MLLQLVLDLDLDFAKFVTFDLNNRKPWEELLNLEKHVK